MHAELPFDARCFACDYLLRGLAEHRCPECGRPFDPDMPGTVNATGKPLNWRRWLLRPPGIPLALIALPAVLLPVWYARNPGHNFVSGLALGFFSVLAVVAWVIRVIAWAAVAARYACPRDLVRPWHWRWFISPLLLLLAWLIPLDSITRFSFSYSRAGLQDYAEEIMRNPTASKPPRWVGLLRVRITEASSTMVRFHCGPGYDGARCGYVYSPAAAPTLPDDTGNTRHDPLGGPWYEYWDHTWPVPAGPTTAPATSSSGDEQTAK